MRVDLLKAIHDKETTLTCDDQFIKNMCEMLFTRGHKVGVDPYLLFSELGQKAKRCDGLADNDEAFVDPMVYEEYLDETTKLVFLFSTLVKFIYPMIEQMDTMIDKKVGIITHDK